MPRKESEAERVAGRLRFTAVLIAIAVGACAAPRAAKIVEDPFPEEQRRVERTLREVLAAAERQDLERLEALHLYGPKFTKFDDGAAPERQDGETARRRERAAIEAVAAFRAGVEDLKVDVFGPVAVATFVMPYEVVVGSETVTAKSRATIVFVKAGAQWKIAHEHFSALRPEG